MRLNIFAALVLPVVLTACFTDVYSTKPETNARLPERPATEAPAPVDAPDPEPIAAPEPAPEPAPVVSTDGTDMGDTPVPYTTKLVRGIINGGTIVLQTNDTLTLAISANRTEGYVWKLDPLPEGLVQIGDYYRSEGPFPDRPSIGGARYFLLRADQAGVYPIKLSHMRGDEIRATKSFSIDVSDPS